MRLYWNNLEVYTILWSGIWHIFGQGGEMGEWWMYRYDVTVDIEKDGSNESLLHVLRRSVI
jgi:hypothetical protein